MIPWRAITTGLRKAELAYADVQAIKEAGGGGLPGADGDSAYQIAVNNGFVGTEQQWLESLHGEAGAPGAPGEPGAPGLDGNDGQDGLPGAGVPAGGDTDQVLAKVDGSDYATQWVDPPGSQVSSRVFGGI